MIRAGIVGATGYGGRELLRLLISHPGAEVVAVCSTSAADRPVVEELPAFDKLTDAVFESFDAEGLTRACDVVFLGVPGTESMALAAPLRAAGARVIDLGPDFRLRNAALFEQYYQTPHQCPELLDEAVYGLVPVYREQLRRANLVAVPGCYPLSALLPLRPVIDALQPEVPVIIDTISGVSGAGRGLKPGFHFPEMNENVWAYRIGAHQHTPEIEQELADRVQVQFSPHVGPYTRGILSTITVRPTGKADLEDCYACYRDEPFVRVLGEGRLPEVAHVRSTNFCDFGWVSDARTGNLIIVSAVDNLLGGTAGMAVHCMNLMFDLDERTGLSLGGMSV